MGSAACRVCALIPLLMLAGFEAGAARAETPAQTPAQAPPDASGTRPLVIPQIEGERQGKILGRALACGAARERVEPVLRAGRERMLAAVGRALTEERYALALDDAMRLETSLPAPSAQGCEKALTKFDQLEKEF